MNRLLLWAGPIVASIRGGVFYDRPRNCPGCQRAVRVMRRSLLGTEGCTTCVQPERAQARSDHF